MSKKLVVIGNGMAGVAAIEAMLKKNANVEKRWSRREQLQKHGLYCCISIMRLWLRFRR